jgi:hypothetical protein
VLLAVAVVLAALVFRWVQRRRAGQAAGSDARPGAP